MNSARMNRSTLVLGWLFLTSELALGWSQASEKLKEQVLPVVESLSDRFCDQRYWIMTDGNRTGWLRFKVTNTKHEGQPCFLLDIERADYRSWSGRLRIIARKNEFLSLTRIQRGNSWFVQGFEKGMLKSSPDRPAVVDPGDLVAVPLIWVTVLPFEKGFSSSFSTFLHQDGIVYRKNSITYSGPEVLKGSAGKGENCHKFHLTYLYSLGYRTETFDGDVWVRTDRSIERVRSEIRFQLGGKNEKRVEELVPVIGEEWQSPSPELNELRALIQLASLGGVCNDLRTYDLDENGANDYWVGDISSLFRLIPRNRNHPIQLIEREVASADTRPLKEGAESGGSTVASSLSAVPQPLHGYFFTVIPVAKEGERANDGKTRDSGSFSICAFPAQYRKTGSLTFYYHPSFGYAWKDIGGGPPSETPADPKKDGWGSGMLSK